MDEIKTKNNGNQKPSTKAKNKFNGEKYDRLYPFVPKGQKKYIEAAAAAMVPKESINDYVVKAVYQRMEREGHKMPEEAGGKMDE